MHYCAVQENWRAPTQHKLPQRALTCLHHLNYTHRSGRQPPFTAPRFLPPPRPSPTENALTIPSSFPRLCHLLPWITSIFLAPYACHVVSPFLFLTRSGGEGCEMSQRLPAHDAFLSHCNVTVNPPAVTPLKKCFNSIDVYPVRPHASGLATQNIFVFYSVSTVWCMKSLWVQVIKDPFKHDHS